MKETRRTNQYEKLANISYDKKDGVFRFGENILIALKIG